ncbi:POK6 protein, partial [Chloroceryle aenea]|nr:POK6 protein [Chloroceryle aenea]
TDQCFEELPKRSEVPAEGLTVFTDASKTRKKAAITWPEGSIGKKYVIQSQPGSSLQTLELSAVVWAFKKWQTVPINIVSDSLYIVGAVQRIKRAVLKELHNSILSQFVR